LRRATYTVTGAAGDTCGHAHPTLAEALPCRIRGRSRVERIEYNDVTPLRWWGWLIGLVLLVWAVG
jgi:hypothetical protein